MTLLWQDNIQAAAVGAAPPYANFANAPWEFTGGGSAVIVDTGGGVKAVQLTCPANISGTQRAEILPSLGGAGEGVTRWFGFDMRVTSLGTPAWGPVYQQHRRSNGTGNGPVALEVDPPDHIYIRGFSGTSQASNVDLGTTPRNVWIRIVTGIFHTTSRTTSWIETYRNGQLIQRTLPWFGGSSVPADIMAEGGTLVPGGGVNAWKMGVYQGGPSSAASTIQFKNIRIGTTQADVAGSSIPPGGGGTPPPAPDAPTPIVTSTTGTTVTLNLGTVPGARAGDVRQLYRAVEPTNPSTFIPNTAVEMALPITQTTYTDSGLTSGTTYYYRQSAGVAGDYGTWGDADDYATATPSSATAKLSVSNPPSQTAVAGGSNPANTTFTITNIGSPSGDAGFTLSDDAAWLTLSAAGGATAGSYARTFNSATADRIVMTLDGFPAVEPITFAAIMRKTTDADMMVGGISADTGTAFGRAMRTEASTARSVNYFDNAAGTAGMAVGEAPISLNGWYLIVVSKTSASPGVIAASRYDFATTTWVHSATDPTQAANATAYTAGRIVIGAAAVGGANFVFNGQIAVFGVVPIILTDTNRQAMVSGALSTLAQWQTAGFTSGNGAKVFPLNQSSTATPVSDAVGGSTQVSVAGTSVYNVAGGVPFATTAGAGGLTGDASTSGTTVTQSYNISGLTAGTYTANITVDPDEVGEANILKTSTLTITSSLDAPENLTYSNLTSAGSVDLAWTASTGPSLHATQPYVIQTSPDSVTWTQNSTSTTTTRTVTGLPIGTSTFIRVLAKNTSNVLSDPTNEIEVIPVAALTAISGAQAVGGETTITITWDPNPSNQGPLLYRWYLKTDAATQFPSSPAFEGAGEQLGNGKLQAVLTNLVAGTYDLRGAAYRPDPQ